MNGPVGYVWKGAILTTHGDTSDAFCATESVAEAAEFLRIAARFNPDAEANIRYMIGYLGHDEARDLWQRLKRASVTDRE